jgi:glutamyl-Q tRNA(Asp) synthetase
VCLTSAEQPVYRGRFAPSPTGPLHFGSLIAAVGSYLDARVHRGEWLVRMENVDRPREVAGAAAGILSTLEQLGMEWDGAVMYQNRRTEAYQAALEKLRASGSLYPCACSRRDISKLAQAGPDGSIYPGTCRNGVHPGRDPKSWRVTVADPVRFRDRLQGMCYVDLSKESGDFVVLRADNIFAYQLAVVVDDAEQEVTHIVRGTDLLGSTGRQIRLQHLLDYGSPEYMHLPVAVNPQGRKLSKQTGASAVDPAAGSEILTRVLAFLGQNPPPELSDAPLVDFWLWALAHWDVRRVPRGPSIPAPAAEPGILD